jgi:hypothetical protein
MTALALGALVLASQASSRHVHQNFLGAHSALGEGVLPFHRVTSGLGESKAVLSAGKFRHGESIRVHWSGIDGATPDDLILLTCDVEDWPLAEAFDAVAVSGAYSSGAGPNGWVDFPPVPDMRCTYIVRYARAVPPPPGSNQLLNDAEILGELRLEHVAGGFGLLPTQVRDKPPLILRFFVCPPPVTPPLPDQAHLSFTAVRSEVMLIWNSAFESPVPQVQYGFTSGQYDHTANATSTTYHAADMW